MSGLARLLSASRSAALLVCAGAVFFSCAEETPARFEMPGLLQRALTGVSDLSASAELMRAGTALPAVDLNRAEDGVTFTGFIAADPGEYTLEIAFSGLFTGNPERMFLGRWTSDVFKITRGNAAQTTFSRALDRRGRPSDRSDLDDDGLPNLDEILSHTDPSLADTDHDGVVDGSDCDPADGAKSTHIARGGSVLDCDADGYVRIDPPFGEHGEDCNDGATDIHPGAHDDCADMINSDCDPRTCPVDDMNAPMVSDYRPPTETPIGCQGNISMVIHDDSRVASVVLTFPDDPYPNSIERGLAMHAETGSERWASSLIQDASVVNPISEGTHRIQIRAFDDHGNTGFDEHMVQLAYGQPHIVSLTPAQLPPSHGSVDVQIASTVAHGTPHVRLYAVSRGNDDLFHGADAIMMAEGTGSPLTLTVDTTGLATGDYLLFPVVRDDIGNELTPYFGSIITASMTGYYPCVVGANEDIPARVLMVGETGFRTVKMRDVLDEAVAAAAAVDPAARLTQINGYGVRADGAVELASATRYLPRWSFGFYNSTSQEWVDVSWLTFAFGMENPVVTPNSGSVVATDFIGEVDALIDSDRVAQVFGTVPNCPGLTGEDNDSVQYLRDADTGQDILLVGAMSKYWRASAHEPPATIFECSP